MASKPFAIIAGVGAGTGASIARKFAQLYSVVLLARNPDNYDPLVEEINSSGGRALGISTDVSDAKSVSSAFKQISSDLGQASLAAAVFNVGGKFIRKPFLELSQEDFEAGYEANGCSMPIPLPQSKTVLIDLPANSKGAFLFSQATIPLLLKSKDLQ